MDPVNVLSLSQQQMDTVRGDANEHLQHHYGIPDASHHHHHHHHHHHQIQDYVLRDGHYVIREEMPAVAAHYAVRDGDIQGTQQVLMAAALAGGMTAHEDHQAVNKLELRWTEQGFCDARGEPSAGHHHQRLVKDVGDVSWEQPLYVERENVGVIDGGHHVMEGNHHVVMQPGQGGSRWEDPSLCDANDEEDLRNEGDQLDPKRTREVRWTEQALCDALAAVKSGSVTAYKASKDYGIPRSTLRNWLNGRNRSRKRGPRVDEALANLCRQDSGGGGGGDAGNLMRNEAPVNSGEEGNGSECKDDSAWRKRKRVWTKQTLFEALNAVRGGDLSVGKAAELYGIPNSVLDYWMKGSTHEKKAACVDVAEYQDAFGIPAGEGLDANDEDDDDDEDEEDEEEDGDEQTAKEKKERLKKKAREQKKKVGGWSEKALTEAMEAIKNNTLTICKASRAYGIPRTTLRNWLTGRTRSRKRGPHTGLPFEQTGDAGLGEGMINEEFNSYNESREELTPVREENGEADQLEAVEMSKKRAKSGNRWCEQALLDAVEAVRSGASSTGKAGSRKISPGGDGRNEEEERYESGDAKEAEEKTKKSNGWTEQALANAIAAIKSGISIRKAGQSYGIPRTTLRNWLNGRTHSRKRGPHGGMTRGEQESAIMEWFFSIQQVCQSLATLNGLRRRVATLSVNKGSPFKDGIPVKKWWLWFNRRHAEVAARVGEGLLETQNRNLVDEMSVVHMITGEHLQILKRKVDSEQDEEKLELALVHRAEEMDSSSQEDEQEDQQQQQPPQPVEHHQRQQQQHQHRQQHQQQQEAQRVHCEVHPSFHPQQQQQQQQQPQFQHHLHRHLHHHLSMGLVNGMVSPGPGCDNLRM